MRTVLRSCSGLLRFGSRLCSSQHQAVLCRSVPLNAVTTDALEKRERLLLRGVLQEAAEREARKRQSLERERAKLGDLVERMSRAPLAGCVGGSEPDGGALDVKARRRAQQVPQRIAEVEQAEQQLTELVARVDRAHGEPLLALRSEVEAIGLGERLATFDIDAQQNGRPDSFGGLVIESPRGIPILVGQRRWNDEKLRRVSGGNDLWFQVREGRGARVLLRTSLHRQLRRSSSECMQMAANLAAFFSDARHQPEAVDVMYTSSRRVASRGSRVGQLKPSKRLGLMRAHPSTVATLVRDAQQLRIVTRM